MSAISGFINTIRNAVYGEQVRGAIISALEQCYSDVESPSLNQAAFTAAINAAYAGGILDIQTVTQISSMTNQQIIYRYNGTQAGYQKGLYYYSALSSSWVLIGSEIHSVSLSSQMTDTNAIYKYTGTQSGMVQNSLYYYNGEKWVSLLSSGEAVTFADVFTARKNGIVPASGVIEGAKYSLTFYPSTAESQVDITSDSVKVASTIPEQRWSAFMVNSPDSSIRIENGVMYLVVGRSENYFLAIYPDPAGTWGLSSLRIGGGDYTVLATGIFTGMQPISTETNLSIDGNILTVEQNGNSKTLDLSQYASTYSLELGFCFMSNYDGYIGREVIFLDGEIGSGTASGLQILTSNGWNSLSIAGEQWNGKKWFAYGTSLTNVSNEGKYPTYLAQISGLTLTNKGISGGKIVGASANIKSAIMNTTDGKLDADIITLEVGANDTSEVLGTIYDTGNDTFCGCLNQCIRYLQANTSAQIVVLSSTQSRRDLQGNAWPPEKTFGSDNHTKFDQWEAIRKVCEVNGCYYIPMGDGCGLGYARMSDDYLVDQIHHTNLGGYNIAQGIWGYLKNIPLWYTSIPT